MMHASGSSTPSMRSSLAARTGARQSVSGAQQVQVAHHVTHRRGRQAYILGNGARGRLAGPPTVRGCAGRQRPIAADADGAVGGGLGFGRRRTTRRRCGLSRIAFELEHAQRVYQGAPWARGDPCLFR